MRDGEAGLTPSWEQLVTGAHPSFRPAASVAAGGRGLARHGRGDWRPDEDLPDAVDPAVLAEDDDMGWGEAVVWTIALAAVAVMLATRAGGLLS